MIMCCRFMGTVAKTDFNKPKMIYPHDLWLELHLFPDVNVETSLRGTVVRYPLVPSQQKWQEGKRLKSSAYLRLKCNGSKLVLKRRGMYAWTLSYSSTNQNKNVDVISDIHRYSFTQIPPPPSSAPPHQQTQPDTYTPRKARMF